MKTLTIFMIVKLTMASYYKDFERRELLGNKYRNRDELAECGSAKFTFKCRFCRRPRIDKLTNTNLGIRGPLPEEWGYNGNESNQAEEKCYIKNMRRPKRFNQCNTPKSFFGMYEEGG